MLLLLLTALLNFLFWKRFLTRYVTNCNFKYTSNQRLLFFFFWTEMMVERHLNCASVYSSYVGNKSSILPRVCGQWVWLSKALYWQLLRQWIWKPALLLVHGQTGHIYHAFTVVFTYTDNACSFITDEFHPCLGPVPAWLTVKLVIMPIEKHASDLDKRLDFFFWLNWLVYYAVECSVIALT